jgi:hypothetical protein
MTVSDHIGQPASGQPTTAGAREPRALFDVLRRDSADQLAKMFDGFFEGVEEQARLAWLGNTGSRSRQMDCEAAGAVRERADRFLSGYRERIERNFDRWVRMEIAVVDTRALSLMSENQLQMQLMAQSMSGELMRQVGGAFEALDGRMTNLALSLGATQRMPGPLRPAAVIDAFISSFRSDDLSHDLRSLVFRHYEKRLMPTLSFLYARLNSLLAEAGLSPQVHDPRHVVPFGATPEAPPATGAWVPDGGVVEFARPQAVAPPQTPTPPVNEAPPATHAPSQPAEGVPMRYRDIVRDRLREWRSSVGIAPADAHQGAGTVLGTAQVRSVADLLQGDDPGAFARVIDGADTRGLPVAIRESLAQGARKLGLASGPLQFAQDEEDAIDLVGMLFQSIGDGNLLADGATSLYGRLVMPYLRLALADDSLFNRRTHPARRLLDALTEACEADPDDAGYERETIAFASKVVERLVAGYREELEIFVLAADELQQFQEQRRRRAELAERRTAEALHGRERLLQARAAGAEQAAAMLARPLSAAFAGFFDSQWRHALEQAFLREGVASTRWTELLQFGETLAILDRDAAQALHGELAARWLAVEPEVSACCRVAGLDLGGTDQVLARMIFALAHPDTPRVAASEPSPSNGVDGSSAGQPAASLHVAGGTTTVPHDPVTAARMRRLRVDQAMGLVDEQGRESYARVAWISPLTGRLLVVNRRGQRKLVVSPEQLASLVDAGRVVLRTTEAPCDLAMKRLWQKLNQAQAAPMAAIA